jgi:hypothetical protein
MNNFVFNKKNFATSVLCFLSCFIFAQENDLYKRLIKESFTTNKDFLLDPIPVDLLNDSIFNYIELDANKMYLPHMGFNYKQNSLYLRYKDNISLDTEESVSFGLTLLYTNQEQFDPTSTETTGDVIANGFLTPVLSVLALRPDRLATYLMQIGVLSDEPFVPKERKKQKALREIKAVYGMDD